MEIPSYFHVLGLRVFLKDLGTKKQIQNRIHVAWGTLYPVLYLEKDSLKESGTNRGTFSGVYPKKIRKSPLKPQGTKSRYKTGYKTRQNVYPVYLVYLEKIEIVPGWNEKKRKIEIHVYPVLYLLFVSGGFKGGFRHLFEVHVPGFVSDFFAFIPGILNCELLAFRVFLKV